MKIIKEGDDIWKAIESGGHVIDVIKIIKELDKAGFYIADKATMILLTGNEMFDIWNMRAEY